MPLADLVETLEPLAGSKQVVGLAPNLAADGGTGTCHVSNPYV